MPAGASGMADIGSDPHPLSMSTAFVPGETQAIEPSAFFIIDSSPSRHAASCCAAASGIEAAPAAATAVSRAAAVIAAIGDARLLAMPTFNGVGAPRCLLRMTIQCSAWAACGRAAAPAPALAHAVAALQC